MTTALNSGWRLVRGAGGYSYWHDANRWSTSVHQTPELAAAAADKLEAGALATVEKQERERAELREALNRQLPKPKGLGLVPGATSPEAIGIRDVWPTDRGPDRRRPYQRLLRGD